MSDGDVAALLPRDERVIQFLTECGGYAWQGEVATDLEWSASMTSRTLSEMEDAERIDRYRIGRRKVVCLPHQGPEFLRNGDGARLAQD